MNRPNPTPLVLLAAAALAVLPAAQAPSQLEKEFKRCADKVIPATVTIQAEGMDPDYKKRMRNLARSTGVVVDPSGLVVSDSAATLQNAVYDRKTKEWTRTYGDKATVYMAPYRNFPARSFPAVLLQRDEKADVSLLRIELPRLGIRLPYIKIGDPSEFHAGAFVMVAGNSFGTGAEGKTSVSTGIFSGWLMDEKNRGRFMTNAAVNPGSNGGPVVDLAGNLQGIVSTYGRSPEDTYYGMGLITPLGIMAKAFTDLEEGKRLFHVTPKPWRLPDTAVVYANGFHHLMQKCRLPLVGLSIDRGDEKNTITYRVRRGRQVVNVPFKLCDGPYTGLCIDPDGYILTSTRCMWKHDKIQSIKVYCDDGRVFDAELLARDLIRGLALLLVDTGGEPLPTLPVAEEPPVPGATALALARPWDGRDVKGNALIMTNGVISALHQGNWAIDAVQFDAGLNDSMVGGALINLEGRLVGMCQLLDPDRTGRNSGISYAVPVASLHQALKQLKEGKDIKRGYLGISFGQDKSGKVTVAKVTDYYPAYEAGIAKGDELVSFAGKPVGDYPTPQDLLRYLGGCAVGDKVTLTLKRKGKSKNYTITLSDKL